MFSCLISGYHSHGSLNQSVNIVKWMDLDKEGETRGGFRDDRTDWPRGVLLFW